MASRPTVQLSSVNLNDSKLDNFVRNRAVTDLYEPGSTMKPFTVALAMELGKITPDTVIQTSPGKLTVGSATISDAHPHGALSVEEVIQKSSNVGTAKLALAIDKQDMWDMFNRAGFGVIPRVQFPGAVSGKVRPAKSWRPIEQATIEELFLVASTRGHRQTCACTILKCMHINVPPPLLYMYSPILTIPP